MNTTTREGNGLAGWLAATIAVHCAIGLWHGAAHLHVPVPLTAAQQAFVGLVIILLPVVAATFLWSRWRKGAALLITVSLLASLLFGLVNHFVFESPDNVLFVPEHAWRPTFVFSAALVAVSESIGTVLAVVAAWSWGRTT
ncbi:MAG: hypothetical protein ACT4QA_21850 [Panacagrimonas sp.]